MTSPSKLVWKKSVSGAAVSASAGDYLIFAHGRRDIHSCKRNPHISFGRQKSVKEAITVCEQHNEVNHGNAPKE